MGNIIAKMKISALNCSDTVYQVIWGDICRRTGLWLYMAAEQGIYSK